MRARLGPHRPIIVRPHPPPGPARTVTMDTSGLALLRGTTVWDNARRTTLERRLPEGLDPIDRHKQEEIDLLRRIRDKDEAAVADLYQRYSGPLYSPAYQVTRARWMVTQYPWLYERAGLFSWREKA